MYRATEDIYFGAHSGGALTRALFCIVELQGPLEDAAMATYVRRGAC
jgi:hypothetical protein